MNLKKSLCTLALVAGMITPAQNANAKTDSWSWAGALNYGFNNNTYKLGFGGRAGYTMDNKIYLGGNADYFLGTSSSSGSFSSSSSIFIVNADVGYEMELAGGFIVTPVLGFGFGFRRSSSSFSGQSSSTPNFSISPGVNAMYPLGEFKIGIDAQYHIVSNANALAMGATVGMDF